MICSGKYGQVWIIMHHGNISATAHNGTKSYHSSTGVPHLYRRNKYDNFLCHTDAGDKPPPTRIYGPCAHTASFCRCSSDRRIYLFGVRAARARSATVIWHQHNTQSGSTLFPTFTTCLDVSQIDTGRWNLLYFCCHCARRHCHF